MNLIVLQGYDGWTTNSSSGDSINLLHLCSNSHLEELHLLRLNLCSCRKGDGQVANWQIDGDVEHNL